MLFLFVTINFASITELIVGFERIFTQVNESDGSIELCIIIMTNEIFLPADFSFSLDLTSVNITAGNSN